MSTTSVAREAFDSFFSGSHQKCGQLLEQIGSFKGSPDVKVSHNALVNEYYKSGCASPQKLLADLTQALEKARERDKKDKGRRKRDDDDEDGYREDEDLSVLRYNQALLCIQLRQHAQAGHILEELFENIEPIDDFLAIKICFLLLELCLLQREPEQGVTVLAYLEKPNAFLTVLRSERPASKPLAAPAEESAADGEEEKPGPGEAEEGAEDGADQGAADAAEALGDADPLRALEARGGAPPPAEAAAEGPLPSLAVGAFLPRHGRAPDTISRAEYRFMCLMYRARLSVALRNSRAARKEVKSAVEVLEQDLRHAPLLTPHPHTTGTAAGGSQAESKLCQALHSQHQAMVNVLKAYLEYTKQNVRKAIKLLTLTQFNFAEGSQPGRALRPAGEEEDGEEPALSDFHPAQDEACSAVFFNNLGCIHFMMQKPNLALLYFQKALQAEGPPGPGRGHLLGAKAGLTLPGVGATRHWLDRRAEVAYNAGLQMLMCERPAGALKCFEQCAPVFRTWPRLWLRMAECCIELHSQGLARAPCDGPAAAEGGGAGACSSWSHVAARPPAHGTLGSSGGARQLCWSVQGGGPHRRWLLSTARSPPIGRRVAGEDDEGEKKGDRAPDKPAAAPHAPRDAGAAGERPPLVGEGALAHAAMCLRNVLVLTAPLLAERGGGGGPGGAEGGAEAAAAAPAVGSGAAAPGAGAGEKAGGMSGGSGGGLRAGKASGAGGGSRHHTRDVVDCEASLLEDAALVKLAYVSLCQNDHAAALRCSRRFLEKGLMLPKEAGKEHGRSQSPSAAAVVSEDAEDARKQWTFQAQSLSSTAAAGAAHEREFAPSIGCATLGVLYAAEALLLLGRPLEARTLLGSFVSGDAVTRGLELQNSVTAELERHSAAHVVGARRPEDSDAGAEEARAVCGGMSPGAPMGGLTPPAYLQHCAGGSWQQAAKDREGKGDSEKEKSHNPKDGGSAALVMFPPAEMPCLGDTQCTLYTNLAATHCQGGDLDEAERCCNKALTVRPHALAPLRTLVYIHLRRGQHSQALQQLKQSRIQQSRTQR